MQVRHIVTGLVALVLLTGCGPQSSQEPSGSTTLVSTSGSSTVDDSYLQSFATHGDTAAAAGSDSAVDLADGEALVLADRVALSPSAGAEGGPLVLLSTKVKVLETDKDWTKVQAPEGSGWVPSAVLAQDVRRAALKADGPAGWEKFTFVGYRPVADDATQVEVWGAPAGGNSVKKATLPRKLLTTASADVNLIVLWRLAALESETAAKVAILNQALARYSSSSLAPLVQEKLDALSGKTVLATTEVSLLVSAGADGTKVWPEPVEGKGAPVADLAAGQQVQVVEQSTEPQTVNGVSARWYKIADPVGWVFGAQVSQ